MSEQREKWCVTIHLKCNTFYLWEYIGNLTSILELIFHSDFLYFKDSKESFSSQFPLCDGINNIYLKARSKLLDISTWAFAAWALRNADATESAAAFLLDLIFIPIVRWFRLTRWYLLQKKGVSFQANSNQRAGEI